MFKFVNFTDDATVKLTNVETITTAKEIGVYDMLNYFAVV